MYSRCARLAVLLCSATLSTFSYAQDKICPNNNPAQRPANITPSGWNVSKILHYMRFPTGYAQNGLIVLISHRGNWEFCPENTLESFQSSWDIGAQGAEMDVRLSAPGSDPLNNNANYPNGEVFLSHDWDLRGEAPNPPSPNSQASDFIYSLTPAQLEARNMSDRHGKVLKDSLGNYLHLASFTQLLQSMVQRASSQGYIQPHASPRVPSGSYMKNGMLLVVDIKGTITKAGAGVGQVNTFLEAVKEMNDFETANSIDLGDAIAFKVQYKDFAAATNASRLVLAVTDGEVDYVPRMQIPRIIFIVFPQDVCPTVDRGRVPCSILAPSNNTALNDFRDNYLDPTGDTQGLLTIDWQYRNEGDALANYVFDPGWSGWGRAMFLASNNFAEGVRNSGGDCMNTFSDARSIPDPSETLPPINTSFCTSDPIQRWSSASLDYLVPSFGPKHATSITTDLYQNAVNYLTAIGLNNTSLLLP
jgi:Glycerophosphoryl diester phosphodiesterase family